MAPTTRRIERLTPPPGPSRHIQADTIKKTRFYNAYDRDKVDKSVAAICREVGTSERTAGRWLRQRESMGSLAYRRTRNQGSTKLGRPSKVTKSMCEMLVDPVRNPVRKQPYKAQIASTNCRFKDVNCSAKLRSIPEEVVDTFAPLLRR